LTAYSFPGAVLRFPDSSWKSSISRSWICNGFYSEIRTTDRTGWRSGKRCRHSREGLGSNLGSPYRIFVFLLQANTEVIRRFVHNRFLPNPFRFTYHWTLKQKQTPWLESAVANYTDRATAACRRS
jgi:hypothetical protein